MKPLTYRGPHPGRLAIVFAILFNTGLSFVISFTGPPYYPGPWESSETISNYFQHQSQDVLMCAFFQFGSAIPLGLLTVALVSQLRLLGANATGTFIALFGGLAASVSIMMSSSILWVMSYPGIAENADINRVLYYLTFAIGGVGYSVPLGLLIAGVAATAGFSKLLPRWVVITGMAIAIVGELSWMSMIFPKLLPLIPLTRFPGFVWLVIVGFMLRRTLRGTQKEL